jgi:ethanolamine utilization protein EutN
LISIRAPLRDSRAKNPLLMILCRVEGSVVATKKNPKMTGHKFLVVRPLLIDSPGATELKPGSSTLVAVDTLGAGEGDYVLVVQGSSARLAADDKDAPVDAVVIGLVDTVDLGKTILYKAN